MRTEQIASRQDWAAFLIGENRIWSGPDRKEQVRKGGLPPLLPNSGGKPPFLTCSLLKDPIQTQLFPAIVDRAGHL